MASLDTQVTNELPVKQKSDLLLSIARFHERKRGCPDLMFVLGLGLTPQPQPEPGRPACPKFGRDRRRGPHHILEVRGVLSRRPGSRHGVQH